MWLGGGLDRGAWFRHRFKEGQLLEGSVRDSGGKAQGTILIRVIKHDSTENTGHLFLGEYVTASDQHYRWWMESGEGHSLRAKALYHSCEGNSHDCTVKKSRKQLIHLEQFRVIGAKEWASSVPEWAFRGQPKKDVEAFHLKVQSSKGDAQGMIALPWADAEPSEAEEDDASEDDSDPDTLEKIKELKESLRRLEKKAEKKGKKKVASSKKDKKGKKRLARDQDKKEKEKKEKKRASPSSEESVMAREKKAAAKKKKKAGVKKRRSSSDSSDRKDKKKKKRKQKASASDGGSRDSSQGSASDQEERLFEVKKQAKKGDALYPRKGDRGPFGSGMPVSFGEEDTSGSDEDGSVFREAPAQPAKSGQLALMAYSHRHPGRLAARMLLKMRDEVSMGSAGANIDLTNKTPPTGVQYLLQILMPQMGSKANIRTQRELRTLMVVLDLLAKNSPGRAADVVAQRVKALERATNDGAWSSAQFLELIPSESSSLLDRDEQVYLSKEALLELKLRQGEKPSWKADRPGKKGEKGKGRGQKGTEDQAGKGKKDKEK